MGRTLWSWDLQEFKGLGKKRVFLIRRSKQSWKQPVGGSGNESDEKV